MGNPLADRRNIHHKEVCRRWHLQTERNVNSFTRAADYSESAGLKLFFILKCLVLNLADTEVFISAGSLGDLAIFLNIFLTMNKPYKHNASYKLPWLPETRGWFKECNPEVPSGKRPYLKTEPSHPHLHFFSQFSNPCTFTMRQSGCLCSKTHSNWQLWIKEHWKH